MKFTCMQISSSAAHLGVGLAFIAEGRDGANGVRHRSTQQLRPRRRSVGVVNYLTGRRRGDVCCQKRGRSGVLRGATNSSWHFALTRAKTSCKISCRLYFWRSDRRRWLSMGTANRQSPLPGHSQRSKTRCSPALEQLSGANWMELARFRQPDHMVAFQSRQHSIRGEQAICCMVIKGCQQPSQCTTHVQTAHRRPLIIFNDLNCVADPTPGPMRAASTADRKLHAHKATSERQR